MPTTNSQLCRICGFDDCSSTSINESLASAAAPPRVSESRCSLAAALTTARETLRGARSPLVCGLNCLCCEHQMEAWKLADQLQSTVDYSLTDRNRAALQTFQRYGKVSASFGEIRDRSSLLVFWDCDFSGETACLTDLLAGGQQQRRTLFIGDPDQIDADCFDQVIAVPGCQAEGQSQPRQAMIFLSYLLRMMIADQPLAGLTDLPDHIVDINVAELFEQLTSCQYGALFFKQHSPDSEFDLETESLHLLVRELNSKTRFVGHKLRSDLNGLGAESVLALASGFVQATNLNRRYPRYAGLTYSSQRMILGQNCDAVVLFGNSRDHRAAFDDPAVGNLLRSKLSDLNVIQLATQPDEFADIFIPFPTLTHGAAAAGHLFRSDGAVLWSGDLPTDDTISQLLPAIG